MSVVKDKYRGTADYHVVFSELIRAAVYRGVLTYPQVAALLGLPPSGQHMGQEVGQLIGEISEDEVANGRPMLSAVVVSKTNLRPGKGFYTLARDLGRLGPEEAEIDFWERELQAVYEAWQQG